MSKEDFEEYRCLVREARQWDSALRAVVKEKEKDKKVVRQLCFLEQKVLRLKKEAIGKTGKILDCIEKIDSSYMRQMVYNRYVRGFSWEKVAYLAGGMNSADTVRKQVLKCIEDYK